MDFIQPHTIINNETSDNEIGERNLSPDLYDILRQFLTPDFNDRLIISGDCDQPEIVGEVTNCDSSISKAIDQATVQAIADDLRRSSDQFSRYGKSADAMDPIASDPGSTEEYLFVNAGAITDHNNSGNNSEADQSCVALSGSVDIGAPNQFFMPFHRIHIKYDLEETYRGRYKSDYFGMNGKNRKPRYVADRQGNHFISLEVPRNIGGYIRVDWLTIPQACGRSYMMPYRFQQDNESKEYEDTNPIYLPIEHDEKGIMKIYLVLIKATQSELRSSQPLKPFRPWEEAFGIVDDDSTSKQKPILNAKQLIQAYQLDQSRLAFTFCSVGVDGVSVIPEWNTTVYSTVMKEIMVDPSRKPRVVQCPQCSGFIPTSFNDEHVTLKRKRDSISEVSYSLAPEEIGTKKFFCASYEDDIV